MTDEGRDFSEVLKEAQAHGYAEADPTLDIEGLDSAHKLQILATLAFRTSVDLKDIYTEGITGVSQQDVVNAGELGYRIKLLAIAKASDGALEVRVHPTMIPAGSPMAAVSGVFNAVFITGDNVGNLMFYGRGAGQLPTASAVWSDTLDIARRVAHGMPALDVRPALDEPASAAAAPMDEIRSATTCASWRWTGRACSPRSRGSSATTTSPSSRCSRRAGARSGAVPVVMMTHEARERDMRAALAAIDALPVVEGRTTMIRVESAS